MFGDERLIFESVFGRATVVRRTVAAFGKDTIIPWVMVMFGAGDINFELATCWLFKSGGVVCPRWCFTVEEAPAWLCVVLIKSFNDWHRFKLPPLWLELTFAGSVLFSKCIGEVLLLKNSLIMDTSNKLLLRGVFETAVWALDILLLFKSLKGSTIFISVEFLFFEASFEIPCTSFKDKCLFKLAFREFFCLNITPFCRGSWETAMEKSFR